MAKIVIVEDNPANMELMTYLLKKFGHTCIELKDGLTVKAVVAAERPDVVVCDIQLPHLDGYGVVNLLKSDIDLKEVPVVAVSSYAMTGDKEQALKRGFNGYIAKPIEPTTFVQEIESFIQKA